MIDFAEAFESANDLDLRDCVYQPSSAGHEASAGSHPYYRLLAGLVRGLDARQVLEVGTYFGGSAMAMSRGFYDDSCRLVTVDVERRNDEGFKNFPGITRVIADALAPGTVRRVVGCFEGHIDILYVDAGHDFRQTFENIAIYGNYLKPRLIVVDDIRLNASMRRMWKRVVDLAPGIVTDVSTIAQRESVGFGAIEPSYPYRWPQMGPSMLAAWRGYWLVGRTVMPRLDEKTQAAVRRLVRGQPR